MADRVSVAIRIGGALPTDLLPTLCAAIERDGACLDWEGSPFVLGEIDQTVPLYLADHEVPWGRFEAIEAFCVEHHLLFSRWAGGAAGAFGPERVVFDGTTVRCFIASDDDEILVSAETIHRLGSYAAVLAHIAAAELEIPPFRVEGCA